MSIDTNEIGGWISGCANVALLLELRRHLDDRLRQLGHTGPDATRKAAEKINRERPDVPANPGSPEVKE